jgi:GT2 family glycosyltransferase
MMGESPTVSVVIRTYNERDNLRRLLYGIFHQTIEDIEIILVDSNSTDGTLGIAQKYGVDKVVQIPRNCFTYGRGLNIGCQAASGKYCVFASAHTYPRRIDWLEKLIEPFNSSCTGLVYGSQIGERNSPLSEKNVFRNWFPPHDVKKQPHPFCHNANAAILRQLWSEFPYDESLDGLEDIEWATRVRNNGYNISYVSDATVVHVHNESPHEIIERYARESQTLAELTDSNFTLWKALKWWWKSVLSDLNLIKKHNLSTAAVFSVLLFRLCQTLGLYQGFNSSSLDLKTYVEDNEVTDLKGRYLCSNTTKGHFNVGREDRVDDGECVIQYPGEGDSPQRIPYSEGESQPTTKSHTPQKSTANHGR